MQGFDYERARADLQIPDNFDLMAMIAIGRKGPKENLPPQHNWRPNPGIMLWFNDVRPGITSLLYFCCSKVFVVDSYLLALSHWFATQR